MRRREVLVIAFVLTAAVLAAQPLDRLTGKVLTTRGEPVRDADVRVEAIFGFAGSDFLGQKTFSAKTNANGEWALIAFKSGIWMFDASLPGHVPDVVALPFNLVVPAGSGVNRMTPSWQPVLRPTPLPEGEIGQVLTEAADAARAGRSDRVLPLLRRVADSTDAGVLDAAGRIALLVRDAPVARPLFRRALERDPHSSRAALGMGSSALMQRDVDAAARAFGDARDRTKDKDERSYLSSAINDLNKAHNVIRGTP